MREYPTHSFIEQEGEQTCVACGSASGSHRIKALSRFWLVISFLTLLRKARALARQVTLSYYRDSLDNYDHPVALYLDGHVQQEGPHTLGGGDSAFSYGAMFSVDYICDAFNDRPLSLWEAARLILRGQRDYLVTMIARIPIPYGGRRMRTVWYLFHPRVVAGWVRDEKRRTKILL